MVDNAAIAELLIREAKTAEGHREQAFRRATHAAFMWPEEAMDTVAAGRSLTELAGIGRSLAKQLHNWIASSSKVEVPAIRREFLTLAQARRVLKKNPGWAPQLNGDLGNAHDVERRRWNGSRKWRRRRSNADTNSLASRITLRA